MKKIISIIIFTILLIIPFSINAADIIPNAVIHVNEKKLPTVFVKDTKAPDFGMFFSIRDQGKDIDQKEAEITTLFDISKVGQYKVEIKYTGQSYQEVKASIMLDVIEKDITPPDVSFFEIEENTKWNYKTPIADILTKITIVDNVDGSIKPILEHIENYKDIDTNILGKIYNIKYSVSDKAGNTTLKEFKLEIVDLNGPTIQNFDNIYTRKGKKINIAHDITAVDNYDKGENIYKILFLNNDLFTKKPRKLTPKEEQQILDIDKLTSISNEQKETRKQAVRDKAKESYTYEFSNLSNGEKEYIGKIIVFSNKFENGQKEFDNARLTIKNNQFSKIEHTFLNTSDNKDIKIYLLSNYNENKAGEYFASSVAIDSNNNKSAVREFRIVVENSLSTALIIVIINASLIGVTLVVGLSVFVAMKVKKNDKKND